MTHLCSEELDRNLSTRERMAMKLHLMMCTGCRNFRGQMDFLRQAMHRYAAGNAASDSKDDKE
ncbi:MAG: zf-HC2 domain-containing protein [Dechloromonas sp.]|nr:zf-HC2 domain-containing protein [Dechloromonas sp.]